MVPIANAGTQHNQCRICQSRDLSKINEISDAITRMVEEDSIRTANGLLVQVPDETPFPEGFEVMHEAILADGNTYRLWKRKQP